MKPNIFWLDLRPVPLKGISCLIMYSDSKAHSWTCHGPFDENLLLLFNQWSWCLSHGLLNNIVYTYRPGCFQFGQGSLCIWQWSIKSCISDNSSQKKKELSAQPNTRQLCCTLWPWFKEHWKRREGKYKSWRMDTRTEMLSSKHDMDILIMIIYDWLSSQYQASSNHDTESILWYILFRIWSRCSLGLAL